MQQQKASPLSCVRRKQSDKWTEIRVFFFLIVALLKCMWKPGVINSCLSDYSRLSGFYVLIVWCPHSVRSALRCAVELAEKYVSIIWNQLFCISSKMPPLLCDILLMRAAVITVFGDGANARLGTFAYTVDSFSWELKTLARNRITDSH